jgi:ketosteroid isomerase-like protein
VSDTVELVDRIYERFNAGDLAFELFHPDVRMFQSQRIVGTAGDFVGREGLQQALDELLEGFEQVRFLPESYDDLGGGVVLARTRWVGRGVASGAPVDAPVWHVWTIEDGLVTSLGVHPSERAAQAAAANAAGRVRLNRRKG